MAHGQPDANDPKRTLLSGPEQLRCLRVFDTFRSSWCTVLRGRMLNRLSAVVIFVVATVMPAIGNADIHPALRMEFSVKESDFSELMSVLAHYAEKTGFTVEDVGPRMPPKDDRPIFYVHLNRPDSTKITVTNFLERHQVLLFLYLPKQDTHSIPIIDPLIAELRHRWPDIHVFTGM